MRDLVSGNHQKSSDFTTIGSLYDMLIAIYSICKHQPKGKDVGIDAQMHYKPLHVTLDLHHNCLYCGNMKIT